MFNKFASGIVICILFVSLLVVFCAVIIKLYIRKIKEHNQRKIEFQKTLNKTVIETQEQVLENISKDLHDDIGQQLTFVNFQLEKIKLDADCERDDLNKLTDSISQVSQSIRDLSHSMNNQFIIQKDLKIAIENEIKRIKKYKSINVSFNYVEGQKILSETQKIIVFRIFQESISNCLKHSKATKIDINIGFLPNFKLEINDNGIGFDIENDSEKQSLGLINIYKRAEMIDCSVSLISKINQGTQFILATKTSKNE